jgi:hypothetical protein
MDHAEKTQESIDLARSKYFTGPGMLLNALLTSKNVRRLILEDVQEPEVCTAAVVEDWQMLEYVKNQTPELCLLAIKQSHYAYRYVDPQLKTRDFQIRALQENPAVIACVDPAMQTPEICWKAVSLKEVSYSQRGTLLKFVRPDLRTPELYLAAVQNNADALQFISDQTLEICMAAVQNGGCAVRFVEKSLLVKFPEICVAAVKQNSYAVRYIDEPYQTEELRIMAVSMNPRLLFELKPKTHELRMAAVTKDGMILKDIPGDRQTQKICIAAVKQNHNALQYVFHKTQAITKAAQQSKLEAEKLKAEKLEAEKRNNDATTKAAQQSKEAVMGPKKQSKLATWTKVSKQRASEIRNQKRPSVGRLREEQFYDSDRSYDYDLDFD